MPHIDFKDYIISKLIKQGYPAEASAIVAKELIHVNEVLQPIVNKWLNGEENDYECHGYSVLDLMKSRGMTYPAALLTIDWLIKEPEKAKKSIERGKK